MTTRPQEILIAAGRSDRQYWRDLWAYRELFFFLAWRDILVRYKQTIIGLVWAIVRPALTMAVFVIIFGRIAKLPSDGVPYPLFVFAALLPWQFFASTLADSGNSLIANASMISKVYFPKLVMPASAAIVNVVDFAITFLLLGALMAVYGWWPDWRILTLPFFMLFAVIATLGPALWVSALNVEYRDFRYIVPFTIQLGLYVSPVGFSSNLVPETWRLAYALNPMAGVIDGFRWAILGGATPLHWPALAVSAAVAAAILLTGLLYFRRSERSFADVI